jgi:hypothetical protein
MSVITSLCQITFTYFVLRKISSAKSSRGLPTGNANSEDFSRQLPAFNREGFHHRLRRSDNYEAKVDYVLNNPVRAGPVEDADSWPFRGKLNELTWK